MKSLEQLQQEKRELTNSIDYGKDWKKSIKKIKSLENHILDQKIKKKLNNVNIEQKRLRDFAAKVWEVEQPDEDITTNDGSFHKTKVKKYPKLSALDYVRGEFKDGHLVVITYQGKRFQLLKTEHKYNEPTKYIEFKDFSEFLKWHGIHENEITENDFKELLQTLEDLNNEVKEQKEAFENKLKDLNAHHYSSIGLLSQREEIFRTYYRNVY